jgi:hypothetical protein
MKQAKKQTGKEVKETVPKEKKSKIALYWEKREKLGIPPGTIHNMRAVLK